MALVKDLIVQGSARFISDAYFAIIKSGTWNGSPIDLTHGGTAGETTAGKVLVSTATSGTSEWKLQSTLSAGSATTATYASNVGAAGTAGTNYVTAAKVISTCNWYDTMIGSDSDTVINRWSEIVAFVANFTETPDLATFLSNNYLAKSGGTMTGPIKWTDATALPSNSSPQYFLCIDTFASGGTTKYATKADTLKALTGLTSTAIGDADEPVYWDGSKFVKAGAYPTKASWNYDDVYLKLSGGTMTGTIFSGNGVVQIWRGSATSGSAGYNAYLAYNSGNVYLATFGSVNSGKSVYLETYDTDIYHRKNTTNYKIWDESNDGESSGLDADLLDGKHASDFALAEHTYGTTGNFVNGISTSNYVARGDLGIVGFDNSPITVELYEAASGSSYPSSPTKTITVADDTYGVNFRKGAQATMHTCAAGAKLKIIVKSSGNYIKAVGIYVGAGGNTISFSSTVGSTTKTGSFNTYGSWHVFSCMHSTPSSITLELNTTNVNYGIIIGGFRTYITNPSQLRFPGVANSAESVSWSNITDKPSTFPVATHNHDDIYLKLSGGTLTGSLTVPINASNVTDTTKGLNFADKAHFGYSTGLGIYSLGEIWIRPAQSSLSSADATKGLKITGTTFTYNNTNVSLEGHKHPYTDLTGSSTTADQAIVSNGTANGWALKTLGSNAFNSTAYLPLTGGTLTGDLTLKSNSGDSPKLIFQRGTLTDSLDDWRIFDTGGNLKFQHTTGSTTTWKDYVVFSVTAGTVTINGSTVWHSGNFTPSDYRNNIVDLRTNPQTFNPSYLKDIVFISEADYTTLVSNGSITKNSITHTYNTSNWYVIEDKVPTYAESAGNAAYASSANLINMDFNSMGSWTKLTFASQNVSPTALHASTNLQVKSNKGYLYLGSEGAGNLSDDYMNSSTYKGAILLGSTDVLMCVDSQDNLRFGNYSGGAMSFNIDAPVNIEFYNEYEGDWAYISAYLNWSNVTDKPDYITWGVTNGTTTSGSSYSLSNNSWTQTITLPSTVGSYILQIKSGKSTHTGVFSIGSDDNVKDEINLHLHGSGPRIYARTNGTKLELSKNADAASATTVVIKYRRLI